jgi:general secretion pathway protein E
VGGLALLDRSKRMQRTAPAPLVVPVESVEDFRVVREALQRLAAALSRRLQGPEPDIIAFLDAVLRAAIQLRASDVHLQPLQTGTHVSFRVNGVIEDVLSFPAALHPRVVMRVKVMSRLVAYVSDRPQDGHLSFDAGGGATDVRVSLLPPTTARRSSLRIGRGARGAGPGHVGLPGAGGAPLQGPAGQAPGARLPHRPHGQRQDHHHLRRARAHQATRGETTQIATIEDPIE